MGGRSLRLTQNKSWLVMLLLLLTGSMTGYAQSNCFTYEDEGKTITGLTDTGQAKASLEIPATVTKVKSGAFTMASNLLTSLSVENGGNPTFASGLFGENANTLTMIDMGNGMSVTNMIALLQSVGTFNVGTEISADGFSGVKDISDDTWNDVTWTNVSFITLPAELIGEQEFGTAAVYGRFYITKEIITFCGSATFKDDYNNNQLFYVANYKAGDGRLHIQRVYHIVAGKGVLIHRIGSGSGYCDLVRYSGSIPSTEEKLYNANMLVGVTEPTTIGSTDGTKTNYILKDGAFHPTSVGTVKANKAYLQLPTSAAREMLTIDFDDETTGVKGVSEVKEVSEVNDDSWYDLSGRKIAQPTKGLYIKNGRKYVIR